MNETLKTRSADLELLIAVIDSGSFSAAADKLDLHVAKVSRAVSRIEQQLNTTLINRTTRRLELTEEGRQYIEQVRGAIQALLHAEESLVNQNSAPKGKLRVDAASPFVLHQITPHVADFLQQYPEIELELSSNEGYVDLLEHKTDIAFRIGHLTDSSLHARFMGNSELFIVASPAYIAKHGAPQTFDDLSNHQRIGFISSKNLNYWPIAPGIQITPTIATSNGEVARQLCLQGAGITCLSGFMINDDLRKGNLVSMFAQAQMLASERRKINALYYKSSAVSRRISAFLDFIAPRLTL